MSIWGALLIPFIMITILLFFFHHRTKWWEAGIPLLVSFLLIGGSKLVAENLSTKDSEIWNGWVIEARYYEDWDEYIYRLCTQCVAYDKDGFCTSEITYDCSYVQYHPAYWEVTESNGGEFGINQKTYVYLVNLFGNETFIELHRNYHSDDGDLYQASWPGTDATLEPINLSYSYENRIQASRSVFNYQHISDEEAQSLGLFSYPKVSLFNYPSVLGDCGPNTTEANKLLRFHNSKLGKTLQLRMWLLCTSSSDPNFGQLQESYWVGGNKNEVVLVLGQGWNHIFSWTDNKAPLIEIRDFAAVDQDPVRVVEIMATKLEAGFQRKQFKEFSYLTVEIPLWAVILTYVITLLVNVGLSYSIIVNEWDDDHNRSRWGRHNWRQ